VKNEAPNNKIPNHQESTNHKLNLNAITLHNNLPLWTSWIPSCPWWFILL